VSELAERFSINRKTAHKWVNRFSEDGKKGLEDRDRRPASCPWATDEKVCALILRLKGKHPNWGARTLQAVAARRHSKLELPSESTVHRIFEREGLVKKRRRHRRMHPGCPKHERRSRTRSGRWTTKGSPSSDTGSSDIRSLSVICTRGSSLGCEGHETISFERSKAYFDLLFGEYGLPERIRSDNVVPFASNALARLLKLSVYFIRLEIYPELIEPGHPEQNEIYERMHRTLKAETTMPPEYSIAK
jgi:putative transposase